MHKRLHEKFVKFNCGNARFISVIWYSKLWWILVNPGAAELTALPPAAAVMMLSTLAQCVADVSRFL